MAMNTGIHVGGVPPTEHVASVTEAIVKIFDSAFGNHMDQETTREALQTLARTTSVENVTLQGCNIDGGDKYHAGPQQQEA